MSVWGVQFSVFYGSDNSEHKQLGSFVVSVGGLSTSVRDEDTFPAGASTTSDKASSPTTIADVVASLLTSWCCHFCRYDFDIVGLFAGRGAVR